MFVQRHSHLVLSGFELPRSGIMTVSVSIIRKPCFIKLRPLNTAWCYRAGRYVVVREA